MVVEGLGKGSEKLKDEEEEEGSMSWLNSKFEKSWESCDGCVWCIISSDEEPAIMRERESSVLCFLVW
jgi:MinD superfamily P-loop ATPase